MTIDDDALAHLIAQFLNQLDTERDRVANLDQLLQHRDALIEAACPCTPDAPHHDHLTGGYAPDWVATAPDWTAAGVTGEGSDQP